MYSIIDIEGNGGEFRKECIIDIAIYKYDGHRIVDQFSSLVNSPKEITPFVQRLTGITSKMVKTAPKFHELARRVVEITEGTTLVGHNIDFDYRMLRQEFKRLGYDYKINTLDTIPLAKKLIPEAESYSLGKLVKSLGIPLTDAHRAAGDARATLDLFKLLISKDTELQIIQQQFEEANAKTYVNKIKQLTQDVPSEKGLIYFQNESGAILFSDYVEDLNKFAKIVFNSKAKRYQSLQQETTHIHYELTASALLAKLMMQSRGIKKKESLTYGLYEKSGSLEVERIATSSSGVPLLKFKSFTQGLKALSYIRSNPEFKSKEELKNVLDLKEKDGIWTSAGRNSQEYTFYIVEQGKIKFYGFYEFHTVLKSHEKLEKRRIPVKECSADLQNEMKLSLLKREIRLEPLPK
ncbi:3'-5' exonuclease [Chryseobacterium sp. A301]